MDPKRRKKQMRLSLAPHEEGSATPDLDRLATNEHSQLASVRYGTTPGSRKASKGAQRMGSRSHSARTTSKQGSLDVAFARAASRASDAAAMGLPTPDASSQAHKGVRISDSESEGSLSDDDTMFAPNRSKRRRMSSSKNNATAFFGPSVSSPTNPIATPRSKEKSTASASKNSLFGSSPSARRVSLASSADNEIHDLTEPTVKRSRGSTSNDETPEVNSSTRRSARLQKTSLEVDDVDAHATQERMASASGSEIESPLPRKRLVRGRQKKPSPESAEDSDEEVRTPANKRRRNQELSGEEGGDASDTSEEIVSSSKRKRPPPPSDDEDSASDTNSKQRMEKDDLDEDLEFLRDSSPPPGAAKKLSAREERQLHLERMKARRASKGAIEISDDEPLEEEEEDYYDSDEDVIVEDHDSYDHEGSLDGFIKEDDPNDEEDMDASIKMPVEFTRHAHKNIKEHFKDVVEWMVHNKLNPAFSRDDPIYRIGFRKVNAEVEGLAQSKFMSSTWRPAFARALQARPIFNEEALVDAFGNSSCVACGRTSHPATFVVTFTGKAYDPETLESLKEDNDSEDSASEGSSNDGDNDTRSVDVEGHVLPSESHRFFVGRFCKQNSSQAHALTHWRWHLYSWVVDWLQEAGYLDAEQVLEREKWSTRRRTKYANRVVDELASHEIRNLWRDFKIQLETAKTQKTYDRYRRG